MRLSHAIVILAALTGCGSVDDTDRVDTDALPDLDPCDAVPVQIVGSEGHTPMDPDSDIIVRFDRALPELDWGLSVENLAGRTEIGADHTSVVFRPDDPLLPETTYAVVATICGLDHPLSITTGRAEHGPAEGTEPWSLDLVHARWDRDDLARRWSEIGLDHLSLTIHHEVPLAEVGTLLPHGMGWARCGAPAPLAHHEATDAFRSDDAPTVLRVHAGPVVFDRLAIERPRYSRGVRIHGRVDTRRSVNTGDLCDALPRGCLPCADGVAACAPFEGTLAEPQPLDLDPGALPDTCE